MEAASGNDENGRQMMILLLDRRVDQDTIKERPPILVTDKPVCCFSFRMTTDPPDDDFQSLTKLISGSSTEPAHLQAARPA